MQEEILIKSQFSKKWKNICIITIISFLVISVIFFILSAIIGRYNALYFEYGSRYGLWYYGKYFENARELNTYLKEIGEQPGFFNDILFAPTFFILSLVFVFFSILTIIIYAILKKCELTVTEKNIIGKSILGRKVTLPLYMVSSFSTRKFLSLISVSSASGRTKFYFIANNQEIGDVLQNSINERQANTQTAQQTISTPQQAPINNLDDLKKLKELLDAEIITKEEFEQKKKQILGL